MSVLCIWLDGKPYQVSEKFSVAVQGALGTMSFTVRDVETERAALLTLSNNRPLTGAQIRRLAFLTHVKNVAHTIEVVGAHHDPMKEWGLDGWDAVHGNEWHPGCGCRLRHVFDHHAATNHFGHNRLWYQPVEQPDGSVETVQFYQPVVHPIEPWGSCPGHEHLLDDHKTHYAQAALDAQKSP